MQFGLTDDQQLFRETTVKFLEDTSPLDAVRRVAEEEPAGFDREWWRRGAELGWISMLVSEDHGGGCISGQPLADLQLVAEEMGRLVSPGPLIPTNVVAAALSRVGTAAQHKQLAGLVERRDHRHLVPGRGAGIGRREPRDRRLWDPRHRPRRRLPPRGHVPPGGGGRRGRPHPGHGGIRTGAGPVPRPLRHARVDDGAPRPASTSSGASPASASIRSRWPPTACSGCPAPSMPISNANSRMRSSSSAPRWSAPSTGSSSSPSSTPRTGSPSAGRWRRTRRSSTASPT